MITSSSLFIIGAKSSELFRPAITAFSEAQKTISAYRDLILTNLIFQSNKLTSKKDSVLIVHTREGRYAALEKQL
jgi:hypothetical protein